MHKDICSSLSGLKEAANLLRNIAQGEGIAIARKHFLLQFSRETFTVILKRALYNNGICQLLPDIMKKKDAKTSLSHITNMEEMNKSNKVITYIPSDLPMRVFVLLDNYD